MAYLPIDMTRKFSLSACLLFRWTTGLSFADDAASAIVTAVKNFDTVEGNALVINGGSGQQMRY